MLSCNLGVTESIKKHRKHQTSPFLLSERSEERNLKYRGGRWDLFQSIPTGTRVLEYQERSSLCSTDTLEYHVVRKSSGAKTRNSSSGPTSLVVDTNRNPSHLTPRNSPASHQIILMQYFLCATALHELTFFILQTLGGLPTIQVSQSIIGELSFESTLLPNQESSMKE